MWWLATLSPAMLRGLAVAVLFVAGVGLWFWRGRERAGWPAAETGAAEGGTAVERAAGPGGAVGVGAAPGEGGRAGVGVGDGAAAAGTGAGSAAGVARPLVVHVAGAVRHPGVYRVPAGARVEDAVYAAGGAAPGGRPDALNLAAPLEDGVRVYVPSGEELRRQGLAPGEAWPQGVGGGSALGGQGGPAGTADGRGSGRVDVNRATEAELDTLPGIGPALARRIVEHRRSHGPFRRIEDLLQVPGIGPAKLQALRPLLILR